MFKREMLSAAWLYKTSALEICGWCRVQNWVEEIHEITEHHPMSLSTCIKHNHLTNQWWIQSPALLLSKIINGQRLSPLPQQETKTAHTHTHKNHVTRLLHQALNATTPRRIVTVRHRFPWVPHPAGVHKDLCLLHEEDVWHMSANIYSWWVTWSLETRN